MADGQTNPEETSPLLSVRELRKDFSSSQSGLFKKDGFIRAVDDVSFDIAAGEVLGLVGESGCGKTTTGRLILRLIEPTSGQIRFDNVDVSALETGDLRRIRRDMQIVFQDPLGSLNPRMTVGELIIEPMVIHNVGDTLSRESRLRELLNNVGLANYHAGRFPHEFSGGQRQRICIARALALKPRFIVCDEAASALDVSIQAQILNLLKDLKDELGLTYLFISHDLGVIRHISDRVAVMYLGQIVEIASKHKVFDAPLHPYTIALLNSVPSRQKGRKQFQAISGDVPSPLAPPSGCRFHTRCPMAQDICRSQTPALQTFADGHQAACHFAGDTPDENETRRTHHG